MLGCRMVLSERQIEILVLDEADRMLDMGFKDQVNEILKRCPPKRQSLLFSATLSEDVNKCAKPACWP